MCEKSISYLLIYLLLIFCGRVPLTPPPPHKKNSNNRPLAKVTLCGPVTLGGKAPKCIYAVSAKIFACPCYFACKYELVMQYFSNKHQMAGL